MRIDRLGDGYWGLFQQFERWYFAAEWYDIYEVLEFLLQRRGNDQFAVEVNGLLQREGSGYRFISGQIAPITNQAEIESVDRAVDAPCPYQAAGEHLKQAVANFGNRSNPDYRNAIKESVSAVESVVREISSVGDGGFAKATRQLNGHPQFEQALINLFAWASNESGIRHGIKDGTNIGFHEARIAIVICSAIVNFLIEKRNC